MIGEEVFSFEKLDVYQRAIDFINTIFEVSKKFPYRLEHSLGDQLRRAALSIANNIAEGSNKRFPKDKKKFYEYSLDSDRECIPMLTICIKQELLSKDDYEKLRENCTVICKMLRKLIQSVI